MKTFNYFLIAGALVLLSAFTMNSAMSWKISKEHAIKFAGTDAVGIFKTLKGNVTFDQNDLPSSQFSFKVDVNSINTGNGMQNKHAVSDKWFDAEAHPQIIFKTSKIYKKDGKMKAKGTMKIHGIAKEMTVPFTFKDNKIKTKFSVNRLDFKVGTMKGMSKKVSNKIELDVTIPLTK